jgi:hypothetical protein
MPAFAGMTGLMLAIPDQRSASGVQCCICRANE